MFNHEVAEDPQSILKRKLGRNNPCWCGSGKKYKKCHYGRESMERPSLFSTEKQLKKNYSKKYCLHPGASENECKGNIVKAHTIQRSGGLSKIAENGLVMAFIPHMKTIIETEGKILPKPLGIRKASTFTGFCEYHDASTFERIEKHPFRAEKEQCFLLSYRALCHELFKKKAILESIPIYRQADMGQPLDVQEEMQSSVNSHETALKECLWELLDRKDKYDRNLVSKDYSNFLYYGIFLDTLPEVLSSGGFAFVPEFDFKGNALQDYMSFQEVFELLCFSLIPSGDRGLALFGWIEREGSSCIKFIKSLHTLYSESEIGNALIRFIFDSFENIFFKISWWESLSQNERDSLQSRYDVILLKGFRMESKKDYLIDDGLRTVNWNVSSIFTNCW